MQDLQVIEVRGIRVLTTKQIAEAYGTDAGTIQYNFRYNKSRYELGKHYIEICGDELKEMKRTSEIHSSLKQVKHLYLWTEKGALLHAKSLNTDKAWEVYEYLVEFYFRVKENAEKKETTPVPVEPTKETLPNKSAQSLPEMNNPIRILWELLKMAEQKGIRVDSYNFKWNKSRLHYDKIGIRIGLTLEETIFELAYELAHAYIHYDAGNIVESPLRPEYDAQAERAATMMINLLNIKR